MYRELGHVPIDLTPHAHAGPTVRTRRPSLPHGLPFDVVYATQSLHMDSLDATLWSSAPGRSAAAIVMLNPQTTSLTNGSMIAPDWTLGHVAHLVLDRESQEHITSYKLCSTYNTRSFSIRLTTQRVARPGTPLSILVSNMGPDNVSNTLLT